jgi:GT2 family glycosyltransferase
MNPYTLRMRALGNREPDRGQHDRCRETSFAHGCAMMVPRSVIQQAGLMPEEYFLYYEEHDWCSAIRDLGYKIYYQPRSEVYHKESVSVNKNSVLKTYYLNRNRILYMRRNHPLLHRATASAYLLLISFPKNVTGFLLRGEMKHLSAYFRAMIWNLVHPSKYGSTQ